MSKLTFICECGQEYMLDKPKGRANIISVISNAECPKCGRPNNGNHVHNDTNKCLLCPRPLPPGKTRQGLCAMHYQQLRRSGALKMRDYHRKMLQGQAV